MKHEFISHDLLREGDRKEAYKTNMAIKFTFGNDLAVKMTI